jgi:hypothetical protein
MSKPHLYIAPREPDDEDFIEAVIAVGEQINPPPPPPRSNVLSFAAYVADREYNQPVFVPFDEFGKPVWTR